VPPPKRIVYHTMITSPSVPRYQPNPLKVCDNGATAPIEVRVVD
jgi:hypothetical protein